MTETALYPIAEVQGLYRTIAELRQRVAAADLYRADAMERMEQQDQTIDALKGRVVELKATLRAVKAHAHALSVAIVNGLAEAEEPSRDYTGCNAASSEMLSSGSDDFAVQGLEVFVRNIA